MLCVCQGVCLFVCVCHVVCVSRCVCVCLLRLNKYVSLPLSLTRALVCAQELREALSKWRKCLARVLAQVEAESFLMSKIQLRHFLQWKKTAKMVTTSRIIRRIKTYTYWITWKSVSQLKRHSTTHAHTHRRTEMLTVSSAMADISLDRSCT